MIILDKENSSKIIDSQEKLLFLHQMLTDQKLVINLSRSCSKCN